MSRALVLVVLAGCAFDRGGLAADGVVPDADPDAPDADPNAPDASLIDADPNAPDGTPDPVCITWTAANVADPCDPALGTPGTITLAAGRNRYDTDTGVLTAPSNSTSMPPSVLISQPSGPQARALVLTGLSIPVGTALVASGSRPLIIIIHGDANIAGTIDVSATTDVTGAISTPGAGGDDGDMCNNGDGENGDDSTGTGGAGGGGGGGYGGDGGDGGDGNGNGKGDKGAKGNPEGTATIVPLRGGCPGGRGGDTLTAVTPDGGRGGSGGGGIELTARGAIIVSGTIAANATGGAAPSLVNAGAGGAGAGGAILLDAEVLQVEATAKLCANGGGGGEGGQAAAVSEDGEDAICVETPRAQGGEIQADGGNGGDGGALATPTGTNGSNGGSGAGGGGGGGSVGRIRVIGRGSLDLDTGSIVSPDPP